MNWDVVTQLPETGRNSDQGLFYGVQILILKYEKLQLSYSCSLFDFILL